MNDKLVSVLFLALVYGGALIFFTFQQPEITGLAVLDSAEITITDEGFEPKNVTIHVNDVVTWRNEGSYVAVLFSNNAKARFTSPILDLHDTFSFKYDNTGTFPYVDVNFGFKKGIINVVERQAEITPEQGTEALPECAECEPGCTNNEENCTECACPCYSDLDCDDQNPCTQDKCQSDPVSCFNERKAGCAAGSSCYQPNEQIVFNSTAWTCVNNEWVAPLEPEKNEKFLLAFLAPLILLLAVLIFVFVRSRPRHGKR